MSVREKMCTAGYRMPYWMQTAAMFTKISIQEQIGAYSIQRIRTWASLTWKCVCTLCICEYIPLRLLPTKRHTQ